MHPDRIIIGTTSERAQALLLELHKTIDGKAVLCNVETAELIKYASNSLLSTKISFANAIAMLSEKVGADAEKVLEGVGLDKRLGRSFSTQAWDTGAVVSQRRKSTHSVCRRERI